MNRAKAKSRRRSPCPVACALDLLGDRWTLLVIRDLFIGKSRFRDFIASPEGIPSNLLTDRLERLADAGIIERFQLPDGSKHLSYRLTKAGEDLRSVMIELKDWGLKWQKGTKDLLSPKN